MLILFFDLILTSSTISRIRTLNKEEERLGIVSKRRLKPPEEEVRQAIINEVEKDLGRSNGPDFIQDKLQLKYDMHVGRSVPYSTYLRNAYWINAYWILFQRLGNKNHERVLPRRLYQAFPRSAVRAPKQNAPAVIGAFPRSPL